MVLTVPLKAIPDLSRDLSPLLPVKIVIDTRNAYERRDGALSAEATRHPDGSAGAAAMLPNARWVKAFNTVYVAVLDSEAPRDGELLGIPLASDDRDAINVVAQLARDAGFDPVAVGPLNRWKEFEPGSRPYNSGSDLRTILSGNGSREFA